MAISILDPSGRDDIGSLGASGERLAVELLRKRGLDIVMTNFTAPVGRNSRGAIRTGEIDIVALDGSTLVFVEVKTRRSEDFAPATANVDRRKQRQITRTARVYRRTFGLWEMKHRFDVVTVLWPLDSAPVLEYHRSFWTEADLNKRTWGENAFYD